MKYLGLDLGSRTLGIATSDKSGMIATSYKIIRHNEEYDKLIDEVCKIVEAENIESIVLGFPKNMNNTIGPKGMLSIEFKEKLEGELELIIAESGIKGIEYKEFMKMCEDIYKNMNGLNIAWNEG